MPPSIALDYYWITRHPRDSLPICDKGKRPVPPPDLAVEKPQIQGIRLASDDRTNTNHGLKVSMDAVASEVALNEGICIRLRSQLVTTLFPYTTLFRSPSEVRVVIIADVVCYDVALRY